MALAAAAAVVVVAYRQAGWHGGQWESTAAWDLDVASSLDDSDQALPVVLTY